MMQPACVPGGCRLVAAVAVAASAIRELVVASYLELSAGLESALATISIPPLCRSSYDRRAQCTEVRVRRGLGGAKGEAKVGQSSAYGGTLLPSSQSIPILLSHSPLPTRDDASSPVVRMKVTMPPSSFVPPVHGSCRLVRFASLAETLPSPLAHTRSRLS